MICPKIDKTCEQCGKEMINVSSKRRFCDECNLEKKERNNKDESRILKNCIKLYKNKYNIEVENGSLKSISPIQWYEYTLRTPNDVKLNNFPDYIYEDVSLLSSIWKYAINNKLNKYSREEILTITQNDLKEYRLFFRKHKSKYKYRLYEVINLAFPEYKFNEWEMTVVCHRYFKDENNIYKAFDDYICTNNFTYEDIINNKITTLMMRVSKINCITKSFNGGFTDLLIWYCKRKYNKIITYTDFRLKPNGYYNIKENADFELRKYVNELLESELLHINDIKKNILYYFSNDGIGKTGKWELLIASKKHYKTSCFYEWLNELYPEWKLERKDFKVYIGCDNHTQLNSEQERKVFDFIYDTLNIKTIKGVGYKRKLERYNAKYDESYRADFTIDSFKGVKLKKEIVIEYYGMYKPEFISTKYISDYIDKTHRKNEFYKAQKDIYFIAIYPDDLLKSCQGVREKLTSFYMSNFNISIT